MLSGSSLPDPPSCGTSGGFLPLSLKCSLLMTIMHVSIQNAPKHTQLVFIAAEEQNHTYADVWLYGCVCTAAFFHPWCFLHDWFFFFFCWVLAVNGLTRVPAFIYSLHIFHYCGDKISQHTQAPGGFMHSTWGAGREGRRVVNDARPKVRLAAFHSGLFTESEETFPCWANQHHFLKEWLKAPASGKGLYVENVWASVHHINTTLKICEIKFNPHSTGWKRNRIIVLLLLLYS